jgi:hypothetical protein
MFTSSTRDLLYGGPASGKFTDITNFLRDLRDASIDEMLEGEEALLKMARTVAREAEG